MMQNILYMMIVNMPTREQMEEALRATGELDTVAKGQQ